MHTRPRRPVTHSGAHARRVSAGRHPVLPVRPRLGLGPSVDRPPACAHHPSAGKPDPPARPMNPTESPMRPCAGAPLVHGVGQGGAPTPGSSAPGWTNGARPRDGAARSRSARRSWRPASSMIRTCAPGSPAATRPIRAGNADIDVILLKGRTVWLLDAKRYAPRNENEWIPPGAPGRPGRDPAGGHDGHALPCEREHAARR